MNVERLVREQPLETGRRGETQMALVGFLQPRLEKMLVGVPWRCDPAFACAGIVAFTLALDKGPRAGFPNTPTE